MSELSSIEKTQVPNTVDTLTADFQALGIAQGDMLLVHSSLSEIGWVCGDQAAVVTALLQAVGETGTVVMPAHTPSNSDPAEWQHPPVPDGWIETIRQTMPAFNKAITPTRGMGAIAECFRTYPGTRRSDHPHVSFCANGPLAEPVTARHELTPFFGMDTPLGELYNRNAKILLLGVEYSRCTAFHLAEYLSGVPRRVKMGCAMIEDGQRVWKWFEDYDYDSSDFPVIGQAFDVVGHVITGKVGCADCRLLQMMPAVDFARAWMLDNRH